MKIRITYDLEIKDDEKFYEWEKKLKCQSIGTGTYCMGTLMMPLSVAIGCLISMDAFKLEKIGAVENEIS